jgi:cytoskeletal protein CcmA (bactofilin family)
VKSKSKDFSIIDKELTVDGKVSTKGKLVIKGVVKGTLTGDVVVIAEEGAVFADTKVTSMTIGGTFEGEIEASKELIILPTGKCSGRVICKDFIVEPGGILNAQVNCITDSEDNPETNLLSSGKNRISEKATRVVQKFSKNTLPGDMSGDK